MMVLYKVPIFLFVIALAVRAFFFPTLPESGEFPLAFFAYDGYYELAENLIDGDGYSRENDPPTPDSMRTPLYPFFIVALVSIFGSYYAVFIAQVILGAVNAVLAWWIARHFLYPRGAFAVGILIALEPYTAHLTGILLTETLFMFLFLLMSICVLRYLENRNTRALVLLAFLLGTATMVRPVTQFFPALILLTLAGAHYFLPSKELAKQSAVVIGIFFLCIAPWAYRNYITFGTSELSAQGVSNGFFALTSSAIALQTGISYERARTELFAREGVKSIEDISLTTSEHFKERAFSEIQKHPIGFIKTIGIALVAFFTHEGYANILERYGVPLSYQHPGISTLITSPEVAFSFLVDVAQKPEALVILGRVFWIVTTLLAFVGGIIYFVRHGLTPHFIFFAGSIAYFALTTTVLGLATTGRFRVPVNPFIFMFAVYAVQWVYMKYWASQNKIPLLKAKEVNPQLLLK